MSDLVPENEIVVTTERPNPGGQHVGTYTGVTVEHIPSGIKVTVNSDRSQHRNKQVAIDAIIGAITSPYFKG